MDWLSFLNEVEEDRIAFQDKLSLAFIVMGAIFLALIVFTVASSMLEFETVEFETPFF